MTGAGLDLNAERNALARVMRRQQPDALGSGSANHSTAEWWSARVAELRACLAAAERFRTTTGTQFGVSEAQRVSQHQASTAAQQTPA